MGRKNLTIPIKPRRRPRLEELRPEELRPEPAYTVAPNATLYEIVRRRPRSEADLLAIKGIGPSFIDKHADSLLELLRAG